MKPSGHWFCERCDDVVHLAASATVAKCPVCHSPTIIWISEAAVRKHPVSDETARQWFERMRQTIATAP